MIQNYERGAQDHRRSPGRTSGKGPASQWRRHYPNGPHWPATRRRIPRLRPPSQPPRQGPLLSHSIRTQSRPMIAADTSTCVAFLEGSAGKDTRLLDKALADRQLLMVPVVLTELLSDPQLPSAVAATLADVPLIEIEPGYWQRAGALRTKVLAKRRGARLGDALIAQTCIDAKVPLI